MDVYVWEQLKTILNNITEALEKMSAQLVALQNQVANNNKVVDSAIALIKGLADTIVALKDDPVALQALADSLQAKDAELAAAVAANTTI
jgi:peptidoglycan hydrolase CwlO-like protein